MLTDTKIARALIDAKNKRGVDVQVVTDKVSVEGEYGKINLLKENGIDVFVFNSPVKNDKIKNELMHNKFALIDNKVWTGSFNWTVSADRRNQENVIYLDDVNVCKKYEQQFGLLKKRCLATSYKMQPKVNSDFKKERKTRKEKTSKLKKKLTELLKSIRSRWRRS